MESHINKQKSPTNLLSQIGMWSKRRASSNPIWQYRVSIGLKRVLSAEAPHYQASLPIKVRELRGSDIPRLLPLNCPELSRPERQEISLRRALASQNVPYCFVAIDTSNERPCFMQWAFDTLSNEFVNQFFRGRFPRIKTGQALLENAYTPPEYRGRGIMPDAMNQIARILREKSINELITFVDYENTPSLKGCQRAGFYPYLTRRDLSLLHFWKRRIFTPLAESTSHNPHSLTSFSPETSS